MPMVDLITQCQMACDELIDVTGRATIEEYVPRVVESFQRRLG